MGSAAGFNQVSAEKRMMADQQAAILVIVWSVMGYCCWLELSCLNGIQFERITIVQQYVV